MLKLILSSEKYHCDKKLSLEVLCTMARDLFGKSNGTLIFTCYVHNFIITIILFRGSTEN